MLTAKGKLDKHSKKDEASECVLWTASRNRKGYGYVRHDGRTWLAHRLAYESLVEPIPRGMCVCHRCDVPNCINADHLFLGSRADNNRDMVSKGRAARGDANGSRTQPQKVARGERIHGSKLTENKVREIRVLLNDGVSQRAIAKRFGVGQARIAEIHTGKAWRHVW